MRVGKVVGWFVAAVMAMVALAIGPAMIGDIVAIMWHSLPIWVRVTIVALVVLVLIALLRFLKWVITGSGSFRSRDHL